MKGGYLVSIVLPTFNGSRFIEQSIQSCLNQTYSNLELIIVDDASWDHTPHIIQKYTKLDPRVKFIRNTLNCKLPFSLNRGFNVAQGKYLTWISDDNCFISNAIECMAQYLKVNSDVDIVYTDYITINEWNEEIGYVKASQPDKLTTGNVVSASFLYRRKIHEKLYGYNENLFLIEDYEFWLRASLSFKLKALNKSLYKYRIHKSSLTSTQNNIICRMRESLLSQYLPKMKWAKDISRSEGYLLLANFAKNRNDIRKVIYYLYNALRCKLSFYTLRKATNTVIALILNEKICNRLSR